MPAYDEAEGIAALVRAWADALDALGIAYELRVYDDGSTDATAVELARVAAEIPALRAAGMITQHAAFVVAGVWLVLAAL